MPLDLRDFISTLKQEAPDEIVEIDTPVDPSWEVTGLARKLQDEGRYPLLLFNNVDGSDYRLAINVHATRRKLAYALQSPNTPDERLAQRYHELTEMPCRPTLVENHEAPVKEHVSKGDEVDVTELPLVTHNALDRGPYIDAGIVIVEDPETGENNAGIYRAMLHEPDQLGIYIGQNQDLAKIRSALDGEPLEVAMCVGTHPYMTIGAAARVSRDVDEVKHMSGIVNQTVGEPMRTVECETVDLAVPASAEFVIEGVIPPDTLKTEGPFGEYPWTYGESKENPVINIKAITHRTNPIHETIFAGHPDHNLCGALGVEGEIYRKLTNVAPVTAVRMPRHGACRFTAFVSIDKQIDGQGMYTVLSTLGSDYYIKNAVVVDDDINVFNDEDVLWAMWTRTHMDDDVVIAPHAHQETMVPSTYSADRLETARLDLDEEISERGSAVFKDSLDVKFGVDATKPVSSQYPKRAEPPEEWRTIDPNQYLP